jgi:hypothetical protein
MSPPSKPSFIPLDAGKPFNNRPRENRESHDKKARKHAPQPPLDEMPPFDEVPRDDVPSLDDAVTGTSGWPEVFDAGNDVEPPPPRGWLMALQFCRGFLSSLVAAGAGGKTALRILQLLALAIGRALTGQHVFVRCRVLLLSFEDGRDELRRRILAALLHHNIDRRELKGWFFYATPKGIKLAERQDGSRQRGRLAQWLREKIERIKPDIVCLDPYVKTHALGENDNSAMDFVCELLATFADEFNIAVDSPHHTRKGPATPGDADLGRGGSSIRDAGRLVYTLTPMSEDEARQFNVEQMDRRFYVRLDSAKVNIVPARTATWFKLVSVNIGNATALYPNGDDVQTVVPWTPPDLWRDVDTDLLNRIVRDRRRSPRRQPLHRRAEREGASSLAGRGRARTWEEQGPSARDGPLLAEERRLGHRDLRQPEDAQEGHGPARRRRQAPWTRRDDVTRTRWPRERATPDSRGTEEE